MLGCFEHKSQPPDYIIGEEFLDQLSDCHLLKKDTASWNYYFRMTEKEKRHDKAEVGRSK